MNDDQLLSRIKAADPAATSSAPLPNIDCLVETALTADRTSRTAEHAPADATSVHTSRSAKTAAGRRFALAAVTAVLLGGGATWWITAGNGPDGNPQRDRASAGAPSSLTIAAPAAGAGGAKCAAPTTGLLRGFEVAFEGTVTSKTGAQVDLRVDHWYRGGDAATVRVVNPDQQSSEALDFEIGQRYLVTAESGVVPVCGGTSAATDEARGLFHEAFEK
ncbi:hypothetical protein B6E66_11960 [Streptomyces maremycinicus]|nr:hypothetical protein B6E66_11960 [Streptomyces sp. B9173]